MSILHTRLGVIRGTFDDIPEDETISMFSDTPTEDSDSYSVDSDSNGSVNVSSQCEMIVNALYDVIKDKNREIQKLKERIKSLKNVIATSKDPTCLMHVLDFM